MSGDIVERTEHSTTFNQVQKLECTDKKRFLECEVTQEGDEEYEGSFTAQDFTVDDSRVEKVSTSANNYSIDFEGNKTCKLYKKEGVLRCR